MYNDIPSTVTTMFNIVPVLIVLGSIFFVAVLVFILLLIFSPKFKGKILSKQIKANKYAMDESKDDLKSASSDLAEATKDSVEITARAIRKGLHGDDKVFCKHCGAEIDKDSKFCKACGKTL